MKKVSIIIPVYNVEKYIVQCIDSVIHQTYKNLDIILIDDGSTDQSGKICDSYAEKDSRIRVFHQENSGAANAKNRGLDHIQGDYFTFIDSDDFVEKDWIGRMVSALEEYNADVAECAVLKNYVGCSESISISSADVREFSAEEYMDHYLESWTCSLFWNKIFKTGLTENIRFRKERRCIDDEFYTYKLLSNAQKVVQINEALYHYRQRLSSAVSSKANRLQITDDALEVLKERYEWIKKAFPNLKLKYLKHDIDIMFYFADTFDFTKQTISKFRSISRYYFRQCFALPIERSILINIFKLMIVSDKRLLKIKRETQSKEMVQYFE